MKTFYSLSIFLALFFSVLIVGNLEAATYYIDGSNGNNSNSGTLASPWKTISKANFTLQAGDTVYIRGGTYTSEQIAPSNSGSPGTYITYQNYNSETPTISGGRTYQANLTGKSYIKIDGLRFNNAGSEWIRLDGSTYNIIQNCRFYKAAAYAGIRLINNSNYNKILNNVFPDAPTKPTNDGTMPVDLVRPLGVKYNVFEGNTFGNASHVALDIGRTISMYNVIRNNFFQNKYHTGLAVYAHPSWHLIENNIFYDQGDDYLNDPTQGDMRLTNPGIQLGGANCIVRGNVADNCGSALSMNAATGYKCINNRIYHNTFNNNLRNIRTAAQDGTLNSHVFKNNILTNGQAHNDIKKTEVGYDVYYGYIDVGTSIWQNNNVNGAPDNRYRSTSKNNADFLLIQAAYPSEISDSLTVDPLFTNAVGRDFTLQSTSPMIDAGTWLTTITSSTANSQISLKVADASYFYDGWGIPDEVGDTIKTENGQETVIQSINYTTKTLTVSPAIDIVNGEGLALNYSGSAPDIGAHEYGSGIITSPTLLLE